MRWLVFKTSLHLHKYYTYLPGKVPMYVTGPLWHRGQAFKRLHEEHCSFFFLKASLKSSPKVNCLKVYCGRFTAVQAVAINVASRHNTCILPISLCNTRFSCQLLVRLNSLLVVTGSTTASAAATIGSSSLFYCRRSA